MSRIEDILLAPDANVQDALRVLEQGEQKIALVVDKDRRLLGTVTDGDARRGVLHGFGIDAPVAKIMNPHPATAPVGTTRIRLRALMEEGGYRQIPLLDDKSRVVDVVQLRDLVHPPEREEWVILMAGGLGQRLRPLTDDAPKPMLAVGGKPILETIIERFAEQGFRRFFITVNYRAEDIVEHFGNGAALGVEIRYVHEKEPRGTAGAIAFLPERLSGNLIVMNGDILTTVDFGQLLDFHDDHSAGATVCVREYDFRIPYGVIENDKHRMVSIVEKPVRRALVSAGIYVIAASALDCIPKDAPLDMPDLLNQLRELGREVAVFPIREYWIDIGRLDDLERARDEFIDVFGPPVSLR